MLVVIPAWNEQDCVGAVVADVREHAADVDVLVVDDGSTDATTTVAARAGAIIARLPYHLGVGGAMRLGYRYGLDNGYDVVVQLDADGQHDPQYLDRLIAGLDHADLVIGARFAGEGDYAVRGPRWLAMRLLSIAISGLAAQRLTDTTSGYRAANRRTIRLFAQFYPVEYLGDTVETLVHAIRRGHAVRQVPVAMRNRQAGLASHSPVKATLYLLRAFAVLFLSLVRT